MLKSRPTRNDLARWFLKRRGHDEEAIAAMQGVGIGAVKSSIDLVEQHRALVDDDMVNMRINEAVLNLMDKNEKVLSDAMSATREIPAGRSGKTKKVPDFKTRLEAIAAQRSLIETTRPKGAGLVLNQQFNNGASGAAGGGASRSFEDRLRLAREKTGLSNEAMVQEAEFEDVDESEDDFEDVDEVDAADTT